MESKPGKEGEVRQAGGEKPAASDAKPVGASAELRKKAWLLGRDGLALQGYDPLSYLEAGGPLLGKEEFVVTVRGVTYRFATKANQEKFAADPLQFEPPYGGWCAYAVIDGDKVEVDPKNFQVIDGKVYLFYKGFWGDARAKWEALIADASAQKVVADADAGWRKLEKKDQDEVDRQAAKKKGAKK